MKINIDKDFISKKDAYFTLFDQLEFPPFPVTLVLLPTPNNISKDEMKNLVVSHYRLLSFKVKGLLLAQQ